MSRTSSPWRQTRLSVFTVFTILFLTTGIASGVMIPQKLERSEINRLLEGTKSPDSAERKKAIESLAGLTDPEVLDAIIYALDDEDPQVRKIAIVALIQSAEKAAVMAIVQNIKNEDPAVRKAAMKSLGFIFSAYVVTAAAMGLQSEDCDTRFESRELIEKAGPLMIPGLKALLRFKGDEFRHGAVMALVEIDTPAAVDVLQDTLEDIKSDLRNKNAEVRKIAVKALKRIGSLETARLLIEAFKDRKYEVRINAAKAFGEFDRQAVPLLLEAFKSEEPKLKAYAAVALGEMGCTTIVGDLIQALDSDNPRIRWGAARALSLLAPHEAVPALIKALSDKKNNVRFWSVKALGNIGSTEAVDVLAAALKDEKSSVRREAARALEKTGCPKAVGALASALNDSDRDVRFAVVKALKTIGSVKAVPGLLSIMDVKDSKLAESVRTALINIGTPETVPALLEGIKQNDPNLHHKAAYCSKEAVDELIKLIPNIQDRKTVKKVIWILKNKTPENVKALVKLAGENDNFIREKAISAFQTSMGDPLVCYLDQAAESLLKAAEDENPEIRGAAIAALLTVQHPEAVPRVIEALKDADEDIQEGAAVSLAMTFGYVRTKTIGKDQVVKALIETLEKDDSGRIREMAAFALGELQAEEAVPVLTKALEDVDDVACSAAMSLGKIGRPESLPEIIRLLNHKDPFIRGGIAVFGLGRPGHREAIPHLIEALDDQEPESLEFVITALKHLKAKEAVPALLKQLRHDSPRIRQSAVMALGKIGTPEAVDGLLEVLTDKTGQQEDDNYNRKDVKQVQRYAVEGLGKAGNPEAISHLIDILHSRRNFLTGTAAVALINIQTNQTIPLLGIYQKKMSDSAREVVAQELLNRIDNVALPDEKKIKELQAFLKELSDITLPRFHKPPARMSVRNYALSSYSPNLLSLWHYWTRLPIYDKRLNALGLIYNWDVKKSGLKPGRLLKDFEWLKEITSSEAIPAEENPYLLFFMAYALKESGCRQEALSWSDRALHLVGNDDCNTPLLVFLNWIRIECLLNLGRHREGMELISTIENRYLPHITTLEMKVTQLPYHTYTQVLKGILLSVSGQIKAAVPALYLAENLLPRDRVYIYDIQRRMIKIILAYRAQAQREGVKKDADESIRLAENTKAGTALERSAETIALITRIQVAITEGEYELAHNLTERINLTGGGAKILDRELKLKDPARKMAIENLKNLKEQIVELDERIRRTEQNIAASSAGRDDELNTLRKNRLKMQREFKKFVVKLKKSHPEVAVMLAAQPMEISRIQDRLDREAALIQYLPTDEKTWIFLIGQEDITVTETSVNAGQLMEKIEQFRKFIRQEGLKGNRETAEAREKLAKELYTLLIGPVAEEAVSYKSLIVVPSGTLHFLPFAALMDNEQYLIEKWRLTVLSASSIVALLKTYGHKTSVMERPLLAMANPTGDLAGAEPEVSNIARYFSVKSLFIGNNARKSVLEQKDLRHRVLHLATHGHAGQMEETFLRLADGDLKVEDIWGLYLSGSPLVTLSACHTSMGELAADEVVSLSNGFIFAGADSVVATLWAVADDSTRFLMGHFYRGLSNGLSKSEALRQAQLSLIRGEVQKKDNRYQDRTLILDSDQKVQTGVEKAIEKPQCIYQAPYFWAPFVLVGNWW